MVISQTNRDMKVTNSYRVTQLGSSEEVRHRRFQSPFHNTCFSEILGKTSELGLGHWLGKAFYYSLSPPYFILLSLSSSYRQLLAHDFRKHKTPLPTNQLAEVVAYQKKPSKADSWEGGLDSVRK